MSEGSTAVSVRVRDVEVVGKVAPASCSECGLVATVWAEVGLSHSN